MVRLGFIEDDHHYLRSLQAAIHMQPDLVGALAVSSIEEFWEELPERANLDILFIDIDLPGQSGLEALPRLRRRFPKAELIMLTQHEGREQLLQAFTQGASGYLLKDFPVSQLPTHIKTLHRGGALVSPQMARWIVEYFNPKGKISVRLTPKELQLLRLFSSGKSYKEAARALRVSVDGVKYRVKKIYAKLNVNNKLDALRAAQDDL